MADDDQQQGIPPWSGWQESLASASDADLLRYYNIWQQANGPQAASPDMSAITDSDLLRYYDMWQQANDPRLAPANNSSDTPPFDEWQMLREEALRPPPSPPSPPVAQPPVPFDEWQMLRDQAARRPQQPSPPVAPESYVPSDEWDLLRNNSLNPPATAPVDRPLSNPRNLTPEQMQLFGERNGREMAAFQQYLKGLSYNWNDEASALAYSKYYGTKYEDELAVRREVNRLFEEENPGLSLALQFAGAVTLPGGWALKGPQVGYRLVTPAQRFLKNAVWGTFFGALAGAGEGEDPYSRLTGAINGPPAGFITGGLSVPATKYVGSGLERTGAINRRFTRNREKFNGVMEALTGEGMNRGVDALRSLGSNEPVPEFSWPNP